MNLWARIKRWLRQRRRRRAAGKRPVPLREFVYLDEVSVYSLLASRLGPIAVEFTDTETTSLQSEVSSTLGANVGVAKAGLNSSLQASQAQASQVLRKSIVQTTFRELYEFEKDRLVLRPAEPANIIPKIVTSQDLLKWLPQADSPWAVATDGLARGELIELEVELETEPIFRISTVVTTMLEIMRESAELMGMLGSEQLGQMQSVGRVMEKLLAGLIPVRARVIDYLAVESGGDEWLVHRNILGQVEPPERLAARPVILVGIAEEALFWKDIRRVLFSGSRYRVLGRLARPGIQDSWTPVKLAEVFKEVAPEVAVSLEMFNAAAAAIRGTDGTVGEGAQQQTPLAKAVAEYAQTLATHFGYSLASEELLEQPFMALASEASGADVREYRKLCQEVTTYLEGRFEFKVDPAIVPGFRSAALLGALFTAESGVVRPGNETARTMLSESGRFIDVELVAIYW